MTILIQVLSVLIKPLMWLGGLFLVRRDAAKDAALKADQAANERMNDADTGVDLTDEQRVDRLRDISKRLGG